MVGERWQVALVRRNAWKIGGSDIWYSTVAFDEQEAADEFKEWLSCNSRKADIRGYLGEATGGTYRGVVLHDPAQRTNVVSDLLYLARCRYYKTIRFGVLLFKRAFGRS